MVHKILVPVDCSSDSEAVLDVIADLARTEGATVRMLHVAEPGEVVIAPGGHVVAYADQETERKAYEIAARLRAAQARFGIAAFETSVRFGDAVEAIIDEARVWGADLIAMATHRRRGVRRFVAGSVAEAVERATSLPVLLVRYGDEASLAEGDAGSAPARAR
jgi:nucleotide-binding universal stress UspA family protein